VVGSAAEVMAHEQRILAEVAECNERTRKAVEENAAAAAKKANDELEARTGRTRLR
jgi:hypothetical protein